MLNSFLSISALVALVPMPLPLIWARSSSSSMSWPAFSMARIMEPEVYRLGGDVSPSFIFSSTKVSISFFFNSASIWSNTVLSTFGEMAFGTPSFASSLDSSLVSSFVSSLASSKDSSTPFFFARFTSATLRYPGSDRTLKLAKKCSFRRSSSRLYF